MNPKEIDPIEEIRDLAEAYDTEILRMFATRAKYPANPEVYRTGKFSRKDSCMSAYAQGFYPKLVSALCWDAGDNYPHVNVHDVDKELLKKLLERTSKVGVAIARYKYPRGLPIHVPEIERAKITKRIAQANEERLGLDPDVIGYAFRLIFNETKRIEDVVVKSDGFRKKAGGGTKLVKTDCADSVERLKAQLEMEAERIEGGHSVGVSEENLGFVKRYTITLY
ncbi:MAG: chorismate mutase [Candidatus Aenigmarchaeota archaeon]|nr:chorismate mutase [Candidatus Aenigmarchaeota archaeon]